MRALPIGCCYRWHLERHQRRCSTVFFLFSSFSIFFCGPMGGTFFFFLLFFLLLKKFYFRGSQVRFGPEDLFGFIFFFFNFFFGGDFFFFSPATWKMARYWWGRRLPLAVTGFYFVLLLGFLFCRGRFEIGWKILSIFYFTEFQVWYFNVLCDIESIRLRWPIFTEFYWVLLGFRGLEWSTSDLSINDPVLLGFFTEFLG